MQKMPMHLKKCRQSSDNRQYKMKQVVLTLFCALLALSLSAQSVQQQYIEKYAPVAVAEMQRSGVPASITLAQGLLESGSGRSTLATKGNNHFGIKCHSKWTGDTIHADDDRKNECFRKYKSADESFRDHSDFLRYSDRYKFLFELERTDYKGWAYGLKQAGYATDPTYASKLIKYVEDYNLSRYDTLTPEQAFHRPLVHVLAAKPPAEIENIPEGAVGLPVPHDVQQERRSVRVCIGRGNLPLAGQVLPPFPQRNPALQRREEGPFPHAR